MRTIGEIVMTFQKGTLPYTLTIPAGTRCVKCPDMSGQYFVDDLTWLDQRKLPIVYHDAVHYGIRLNADQVQK